MHTYVSGWHGDGDNDAASNDERMLGGDAIRKTLEVTTAYEEREAAMSVPSGGQREAV